jgi:hypothetical protein
MILLGTIHFDLQGPARLEKFLYKTSPNSISIEFPRDTSIDRFIEDFDESKKYMSKQIENSNIHDILKQFMYKAIECLGYEVTVPVAYAKKHKIDLFPVDHPQREISTNGDLTKLINYYDSDAVSNKINSLNIIYNQFLQERNAYIDRAYYESEIIRELISYFPEFTVDELVKAWPKDPAFPENRERFLADEIKLKQPELNIGGMVHVFPYDKDIQFVTPLYKRLGDISLEKKRLCEVDKIDNMT